MMLTQKGKLLYISDNAAEYLGHSMVSSRAEGAPYRGARVVVVNAAALALPASQLVRLGGARLIDLNLREKLSTHTGKKVAAHDLQSGRRICVETLDARQRLAQSPARPTRTLNRSRKSINTFDATSRMLAAAQTKQSPRPATGLTSLASSCAVEATAPATLANTGEPVN